MEKLSTGAKTLLGERHRQRLYNFFYLEIKKINDYVLLSYFVGVSQVVWSQQLPEVTVYYGHKKS